MLKNISIENFRIFKNKTSFELAPLTLLTGPNNSGKSSFTKILSLLTSNFSKENSSFSNVDFFKGNHQLGDFKNVINWDTKSDKLFFEFDFPLNYFNEEFKIQLVYKPSGESGRLYSFKIFNRKTVLLDVHEIEADRRALEVGVRGDDFAKKINSIHWNYKLNLNFLKKEINKYNNDNQRILLLDYYVKREKINSKQFIILNKIEELIFGSTENYISFYTNYKHNYFNYVFDPSFSDDWSMFNLAGIAHYTDQNLDIEMGLYEDILQENNVYEEYKKINITSVEFSSEMESVFNEIFTFNIYQGFQSLKEKFGFISTLSALRGNTGRILLDNSNFEINSLIKEFSGFLEPESDYFVFLRKSLNLLGIKGELKIKRVEAFGTLLYIKRADKEILLSDLGYGYSQVIPILLKIIIESENIFAYQDGILSDEGVSMERHSIRLKELKKELYPTIIIEEPEANLHPELQSKLADIFVLAYKTFGVHLILETHSEYLIRKLQYLTAKKEINKGDAIIYYFNKDENVTEKEKKVKEIKINQFGGLTDTFGPGFYDEATKLQFELLKLSQERNN